MLCFNKKKDLKSRQALRFSLVSKINKNILIFFFLFKLELKSYTSLTRMICRTPASLEGRFVILHSLRQIGLPCHQPSNREKTQIIALLCGYYLEKKNGDGVKNKAKQNRKWLILASCTLINS